MKAELEADIEKDLRDRGLLSEGDQMEKKGHWDSCALAKRLITRKLTASGTRLHRGRLSWPPCQKRSSIM